ncbi:AsmA family protein [Marinobacterium jannaschii]|uniref:AsmA family protein n=1 Tax=Marinobacterium jannaschii TaxID=64970 RepID=UPI00048255E9|nr:AsmA family protein [Marinobacterium jannaschii]
MKTLTKILLALVLFFVVLGVAGGAILGIFFDPNEYKTEIEKAALDNAGIELKIGGEIGWSVYPWLGLELNQLNLRYAGKAQLASLEQAQLAVSIPALFSGQVKMQSLQVNGLDLSLQQDKSGNNWSGDQAKQPESDTATDSADSSKAAPLAIDIESVVISDANIRYNDKLSGSQFILSRFNMNSGRIALQQYFPAELSFHAEQLGADGKTIQIASDTRLKANFLLDIEKQHYQVNGLDAIFDLSGALLPKPMQLKLHSDIEADLEPQQAVIKNLAIEIDDLELSGDLQLKNFAKPQLSGELAIAEFDPKKLLKALGQPEIETTDPDVLRRVSLSTKLAGTTDSISLNPLSLKLDDTRFNGSIGYGLTSGALKLKLKGDAIDADRYLPPQPEQTEAAKSEQSASGPAAKGERYSKQPVIPVEPLKALNLDADLALGKLKVNKMDLSQLQLEVSAKNGLVNARRINADMYGGTIRNSATLDVRKTPVRISGTKDIRNIQIGDVLKDLMDKDMVTGNLSAKSDISAEGRSVYDIVHSMNGTASVQMKDGVLKDIDIAYTVCEGMNKISAFGINPEPVDRSTPFANLSASTKIVNGVVNNPDLKANLDAMVLNGKGSIDLPKESLDYRLGLIIEENLFKQSCSINNKIEGIEWPVNCKGGFDDDPAKMCRPDLSGFKDAFKQKAKAELKDKYGDKVESKKTELKEKKTELKDKLKEKLGGEEKAKELLKGLF